MVLSANPLALSIPDPAFETWLRDCGYLEVIDQRTSDLHRLSSSAAPTSSTVDDSPAASINNGFFFLPVFPYIITLISLLTLNPFSKVTADDLSGDTPSWTRGFIGILDSYSFPSSPSQARFRVHENARRYARNYASLFILFLACSLYQIPLALVGLISTLALWDLFRIYGDKWGLDRHPIVRQTLIRVAQCAAAVILVWSNFQLALFFALGVGYAVMILHASFRKLTPCKPTSYAR